MATENNSSNAASNENSAENQALAEMASVGAKALPVFAQAIASADGPIKGLVNCFRADDNALPETMNFVSFTAPKDVIVSRWFPGYREADLTGKAADEAVGLQLASRMRGVSDLEQFRKLLTHSEIAVEVVTKLLPRAGVPVKRGIYLVSEAKLAKVVAEELRVHGVTEAAIVAAYTYVFMRVFTTLELVAPGPDQKIVMTASSYAVNPSDLITVIMVDALRDVFSDARIASVTRALNRDAVPDVIADSIGRMLAGLAMAIPEVKLRLSQLELVVKLVSMAHLAPDRLSDAVAANTALQTLSAYANFVAMSLDTPILDTSPSAAVAEQREACQAILTAIQSAPSIEIMSLTSYAKLFGMVPGASPEGLNRGAVIYMAQGQSSKMDVVDAYTKTDGAELQLVPKSYVPVTAVAQELNRSLLNPKAMAGVANLVADEMGEQPVQLGEAPLLVTLGVAPADLRFIAMAHAASLAFAVSYNGERISSAQLVYSARVSEQWRQRVLAAHTNVAFFTSPASLITYSAPAYATEPTALPSRPQSFGGLSEVQPTMYRANILEHLGTKLEKRIGVKIPLRGYANAKTKALTLNIRVLSPLLGFDEDGDAPNRDNGGDRVAYRAVREPGVDRDIHLMLHVILAYTRAGEKGDNEILSDRAKSWLVETMVGMTTHPAIRILAEQAANKALIAEGIDARALTTQMREFTIRAAFGTALAVLAQFEKIPTELANNLKDAVPISNLTTRAQLGLAALQGATTHAL